MLRFSIRELLWLTLAVAITCGWWLESVRETVDTVGSIRVHRAISGALVVLSTVTLVAVWFHKS